MIGSVQINFYKLISPFILVLLGLLFFTLPTKAAPATFTVTNTDDSGAGSLRQAIIDSNANANPADTDVIEFNIPGSGVKTITLATQLPALSEKVMIDGFTQPGATVNTATAPLPLNGTILIELDFGSIAQDVGLEINADDSVIKGISFFSNSSFDGQSLIRVNANNPSFYGNYGGVRADGLTRVDSKESGAVTVIQLNNGFNNCNIGSTNAEDRNVIATMSKSTSNGTVALGSGSGCNILGNYFGVAKDGVSSLGGFFSPLLPTGSAGLNSSRNNMVIGGSSTGSTNVFSGSSIYQIAFNGTGIVIQGNYIGTDYTGSVNENFSNGSGIAASASASDSLIGGTGAGELNIIAGVNGNGISVNSITIPAYAVNAQPSDIAILGNIVHSIGVLDYINFGTSNLGIDHLAQEDLKNPPDFDFDFTEQGPTPNDPGDADTGANGYINTPVLKSAIQSGNQLSITYDLDALDSPTNNYRIEFFANNNSSIFGFGPGEKYLGAVTSTVNGTDLTTVLTVSGDQTDKALSSTATAINAGTSSGFGSTSEFSQNISIGSITDADADGTDDEVENGAPNGGDGNNDGIADRLQSKVTSFKNTKGVYITLINSGCNENGVVSSIDADSLSVKDTGFDYPHGLTSFSLNCSRGDTVEITQYIHDDQDISERSVRKYNPNTRSFTAVAGATIDYEAIGGKSAMKIAYSITDGGTLDDDNEEDGVIIDPVGLAIVAADTDESGLPDSLANTGIITTITILTGLAVIYVVTFLDYKKHKRPLLEAEPEIAKGYTYFHHLSTVTIPLVKYRFKVVVFVSRKS